MTDNFLILLPPLIIWGAALTIAPEHQTPTTT